MRKALTIRRPFVALMRMLIARTRSALRRRLATALGFTVAAEVDACQLLDRSRAEAMNALGHDIKIPLTAVIGYTELLEEEVAGPLTATQREYVHNIGENSARAVRLLEDLLDFARLEVGRFPIDATEVLLRPALERVVQNLKPLSEAQNLSVEVEAEHGLPTAWADAHRLDQVLVNLLSNAIKFTPPGGSVRLTAGRAAADGMLLIQVIDNGPGIAAPHLPHLFERFYRVPGGNVPGTGLGLAISRKLIEAMGGTIGVLSKPGEGSTFWFTLPSQAKVAARARAIKPEAATGRP